MSQRCLISYRNNVTDEDSYYDCIYDENGSLDCLLKDWICLDENGYVLSPWKLNIRDKELFPKFLIDFANIKCFYPRFSSLSQCWAIYIDGVETMHNYPDWFIPLVKEILNENTF